MKLSKIFSAAAFAVLTLATGCSDNEGPYSSEFESYDIVQLTANGTDATVFTMYRPDNDEPIIYTDSRNLKLGDLEIGDRLLLGYVTEGKPYVSGPIRAVAYSLIQNDDLTVYDQPSDVPATSQVEGIYIYSVWRMGRFINVHGKTVYSDDDTNLALGVVRDDVEAQSGMLQLYLTYTMERPVENFRRDFYASFDIGEVWLQPWCNGVTVNVNNTNLPVNQFQFNKQ